MNNHKKFLIAVSLTLFAFTAFAHILISTQNISDNSITGLVTSEELYYFDKEKYSAVEANKIHIKNIESSLKDTVPTFILETDVYYGSPDAKFSSSGYERFEKWTAAVNTVKGTNCRFPLNSVMYIYFGKGHNWNGIYRAEDTVSELDGECKIKLYAGQSKNELYEKEVSGKTAQVFLLNKNFVYVSGADASENIPASELGHLSLPYAYRYIAKDVTSFFDITKNFAKIMLQECSNKPYEQKDKCIDEQVKKSNETGIVVQRNCLETQSPKFLNLTELSKNYEAGKTIVRFGGVPQPEELSTDGSQGLTLKLRQLGSDEILSVKFDPSEALLRKWEEIHLGTYVEFSFALVQGIQNGVLNVKIGNQDMTIEEQMKRILIDPNYYSRELLKETALQIADCASSVQESCFCNVTLKDKVPTMSFAANKISFTDFNVSNKYVEVPVNIYPQDFFNTAEIVKAPLADFSYILHDDGFIGFKKDKEGDFILINSNYENDTLPVCKPEKKHALFCAIPVDAQLNDGLNEYKNVEEVKKPITPAYSSCPTQVDSLFINLKAFNPKLRPKVEKTIKILQEKGKMDVVVEASKKFPEIPVQMIVAIINTEVGTYTDDYIDLDGQFKPKATCNPSFCGLMQIGEMACIDTAKTADCDWNAIQQQNDIDLGIMSGTAYLSKLVKSFMGKNDKDPSDPFINPDNPDWQFIALAYNAGFGSARNIMRTAKARLGKKKFTDLKWEDIRYSDISKSSGYTKIDKLNEIWAYPNFVGQALADQCGGAYYDIYNDEPEPIRFALSI